MAVVTQGKNYINTVRFLTQTDVLGHQCVLTFTSHKIMFNLDFSVHALWGGPPIRALYAW